MEDVGGGQPGGVFAPPVENGFGAAVGKQIASVADALDDQRDRNVVDDQLKELFGVFEFLGQRFAFGDIVEQRNQEFRIILVAARGHAIAGENAFLRNALDHEFVADL